MWNLQLLMLIALLKVVFSPTFSSLCTALTTEKTPASDRGKRRKSQGCFMFLFFGPQRGAILFNDISSLTLAFCLCLGLLRDQKQRVISILFDALSKDHGELTVHSGKWHLALVFPCLTVSDIIIFPHSFYWNWPLSLMSFIFCHFPELSPSRLCPFTLILVCASPHSYPSFPLLPSLPAIPSVLSWSLPRELSSLPPSTETMALLWEQGCSVPFQRCMSVIHVPHGPGHSSRSPLLLPNQDFSTNS